MYYRHSSCLGKFEILLQICWVELCHEVAHTCYLWETDFWKGRIRKIFITKCSIKEMCIKTKAFSLSLPVLNMMEQEGRGRGEEEGREEDGKGEEGKREGERMEGGKRRGDHKRQINSFGTKQAQRMRPKRGRKKELFHSPTIPWESQQAEYKWPLIKSNVCMIIILRTCISLNGLGKHWIKGKCICASVCKCTRVHEGNLRFPIQSSLARFLIVAFCKRTFGVCCQKRCLFTLGIKEPPELSLCFLAAEMPGQALKTL